MLEPRQMNEDGLDVREANHRMMNMLAILLALFHRNFSKSSDQCVRGAVTKFVSRGKRGCLGPHRREVRTSLTEPAADWPRGPARGLRVRLRRPGRTSGLPEHHQAAPDWVHKDD
jgi:hypothetical protein